MKLYEIDNIKNFTQRLFVGTDFDEFPMVEAAFSTLIDVTIDGHAHEEFLTEEEKQKVTFQSGVISWAKAKPLCFEILKGKRLPLRFKIVFMLPERLVRNLISNAQVNYRPEDVNALFLNIKYESGKLSAVTGTSLKVFTMDRSLEEVWDAFAGKML